MKTIKNDEHLFQPQPDRHHPHVLACKLILQEEQRLTFLTEPKHAETRQQAIEYLTDVRPSKRDATLAALEQAVASASRLRTLADKTILPDALNAWVAKVARTEKPKHDELTMHDLVLTYARRQWVLSHCLAKFVNVVRWSVRVRPLQTDKRKWVNRLLLSYEFDGVEYRHSLEFPVTTSQEVAEAEIPSKIKVLHPAYNP